MDIDGDGEEQDTMEHLQRRAGDRDKLIHDRLSTIEKDYRSLTTTVTHLESTITLVQLEQQHFKEMMQSHLKLVDESNKQQLLKLESIARDIADMGNNIERTPVARDFNQRLQTLLVSIDECNEKIDAHTKLHSVYKEWQDSVKGIFLLAKWLGIGTLIALGVGTVKMLQIILR